MVITLNRAVAKMLYRALVILSGYMSRLQQARKLSKLLIELIHERGWTERELARRAEISSTSIQNYMDGITLPNKENRERLAAQMGMSVDQLDIQIGVISSASPTQGVDAICRDIELLSRQDFEVVFERVFKRALRELKSEDAPVE